MVQKVFTAKNGRKYIKNERGQVRFISDKSKKASTKGSTKKGRARKNQPKGSRLAYDYTKQEMQKMKRMKKMKKNSN